MPRSRHDEAEELSVLIGDAYDASLDPGLWPSVLEKLCVYAQGSMANLFSQDSINHHTNRFFNWGGDPYYLELYIETYAGLNPLMPKGLQVPLGEVISTTDILPVEEYRASRFYQEWAKPQGYVDFAGINIEKVANSVASLAVVRHERDGMVDAEMRRRMGLIAPHVRRALLIGKVIDLNKVQATAFSETIDGFACGVILVDGDGRLVHANDSGQAMLGEGRPVRLVGGEVVAADVAADAMLKGAFAAAARGELFLDSGGLALRGRRGRRSVFVAHVLPLVSGTRKVMGLTAGASAALFIRKAGMDLDTAVAAASRLYRLTPAETRVLQGLMQTGGITALSAKLKLSPSTVKRHLEHVFVKTGSKRQADLVKLIAGFDSPVRPPSLTEVQAE